MDFLIVGAGINGLLLARELALADAEVMLLEKGLACSEASWAGGGIVSPLYPWRYGDAVTALANWAQEFYPQLSDSLFDATGIDPQFTRSGLLMLDTVEQRQALRWAKRNRRKMEAVNTDFIFSREPNLAHTFTGGLWMPDVANVRNPRLGQALLADLQSRTSVTVREHCQVVGMQTRSDKIVSVRARHGQSELALSPGRIVLCAGAWSGVLAAGVGVKLPVEPVKGQMLLYSLPIAPVQSIVLSGGRYLIPRRDGCLLAGSTLEYEQFDKTVTPQARESLQSSAEALLPQLQSIKPVFQWAGLRPGAPQGIPFIGMLPGFSNLFVNAGQFRNGLVLAPASARLMADILLGRNPVVDPAPYRPDRPVQ